MKHTFSTIFKSMASGAIISWQIDREIMETVADFIFLGSKITAYGECSHEVTSPGIPSPHLLSPLLAWVVRNYRCILYIQQTGRFLDSIEEMGERKDKSSAG